MRPRRACSETKSRQVRRGRTSARGVQDAVKDPDPLGDSPRIIHAVERAAGLVRHFRAVAVELHRGADYVVPLAHQHRGSHRRIDAALDIRGRGREPSVTSGRRPCQSARTLSARAGKTSATRSMHASVVSEPRLMRIAALAMSARMPSASSTCDARRCFPLWHAEPPEQAIPWRSSATSASTRCRCRGRKCLPARRHGALAAVMITVASSSCGEDRRFERRSAQLGEARGFIHMFGERQLAGRCEHDRRRRRSRCRDGGRDSCGAAEAGAAGGSSGVPRRMYIAPISLGAPIT